VGWNCFEVHDVQTKLTKVVKDHLTVLQAYEVADLGYSLHGVATMDPEQQEPEDLFRDIVPLAAVLDPTTVSGIISA
jgi:hypothetical protein